MGDSPICLCPIYSVILFWSVSHQKTCFTKIGCWKWKQASQCFCGNLRIFLPDLTQNVWRFEVVSNILLRPPSFVISSMRSSSSMDKVGSPGLFTNGLRSHSFPVQGLLWLGSNAHTLLKAEIGDHSPAGREKALPGSASFKISASV